MPKKMHGGYQHQKIAALTYQPVQTLLPHLYNNCLCFFEMNGDHQPYPDAHDAILNAYEHPFELWPFLFPDDVND